MVGPNREPATAALGHAIAADLIAVLVAVSDEQPRVMTIQDGSELPSGPFEQGHRSLQTGLRAWVEEQTRHPLGYVEQLYTFADRDRIDGATARHTVSISYLGLTREDKASDPQRTGWRNWYDYFPWEDHRAGTPEVDRTRDCAGTGEVGESRRQARRAKRSPATLSNHLRPRRRRLERGTRAAAL